MYCKKLMQYLSKNPSFNATIHLLLGLGAGILITYPIVGSHPLRWGLSFLGLGILGHLYPYFKKR